MSLTDPRFQTPYGTAYGDNSGSASGPRYNWGVGGFPRPIAPRSTGSPFGPSGEIHVGSAPTMPGGFPAPLQTGAIGPDESSDQPSLIPGVDLHPDAAPATSAYGGAANSTQRWQQGALRQFSPARQFSITTGLIDGRAPQAQVHSGLSYSDRGPTGFTPQAQWDDQFKAGKINIPKSKWAPY